MGGWLGGVLLGSLLGVAGDVLVCGAKHCVESSVLCTMRLAAVVSCSKRLGCDCLGLLVDVRWAGAWVRGELVQ
jgi:hypothetical protein